MRIQSLQNQQAEIDYLLARTLPDSTLGIHWVRYICVLVAGFLENALQEIYKDYARRVADENVANYVSNQIGFTVGTPNSGNFIRTAKSFSEIWAEELRSFIDQDGRRDAIDTIIRNRNLIAHGGQSTISPVQLRDYLPKCVAVIDFIESELLKPPNV